MKKIFSLISICTAFVIAADQASAKLYNPYTNYEDYFYMSLSGNASFLRNTKVRDQDTSGRLDYNNGGGANLAFGVNLFQTMRAEIEGGYHILGLEKSQFDGVEQDKPKGNMRIITGMVNLYADFHNFFDFTPYVGGGVGYASVVIPSSTYDTKKTDDNRKAYQLMTGIAYTAPSLPCVNWYLGYRYQLIEAPSYLVRSTSSGTKITFEKLGIHNAELGVRWNF